MTKWITWVGLAIVLASTGCYSKHKVDMTHEVKPIHITLDINLKIDRELDNFFGDVDQAAANASPQQN
ncbi:MAG: hypothetical protein FJ220_04795 [Kiritimatiellaceae bacterium]|nr:hypothetical protein [Kiritimatiellaceae bacterium]